MHHSENDCFCISFKGFPEFFFVFKGFYVQWFFSGAVAPDFFWHMFNGFVFLFKGFSGFFLRSRVFRDFFVQGF